VITINDIVPYLEQDGFTFDLNEEKQYLSSGFRSPQGSYRLVIQLASEGTRALFLVREFDYLRDERRPEALQTLLQLNYELIWGGFAVDFRDGEVVFQVGVSTEGIGLPYELYSSMMSLVNYIMSTYRDVLKMVVFGKMDPTAAIEACQQPGNVMPAPPPNGTSPQQP
jgi:hypothetical protein